MTLVLTGQEPFARGGNRLCFVHPEDDLRCIKVRRPDFTLEDRRREKGFPKNLKPLASFDDNREEYLVMKQLRRTYGEPIFRHISRCFGFVDTDLGKGLVSELIRDHDGAISQTLKKYLWDHGLTEACQVAINDLCRFWEQGGYSFTGSFTAQHRRSTEPTWKNRPAGCNRWPGQFRPDPVPLAAHDTTKKEGGAQNRQPA